MTNHERYAVTLAGVDICVDCSDRSGRAVLWTEAHPEIHEPFTDDGVTYCGWDGHEGCGELWPCRTVREGQPTTR